MDGTLITYMADHPAATTFAILGLAGVAIGLIWHTAACKKSRRDMYNAVKDLSSDIRELSERISTLEGATNAGHMADVAAIATAVKQAMQQ